MCLWRGPDHYHSTDTLKAQIMVDISCMPGWTMTSLGIGLLVGTARMA